jgi:hypothetical protein
VNEEISLIICFSAADLLSMINRSNTILADTAVIVKGSEIRTVSAGGEDLMNISLLA